MHIDSNVNIDEWSTDHPVTSVLNDREEALYISAAINLENPVAAIEKELGKDDSGIESPELVEARNQLNDVLALCELIEEAAETRKTRDGNKSHVGNYE